jgi:spermidine/putrescine transport system permease protein
VDRTLIEAAHNLRCGGLRTVFQVVIPAAKTGLVLAATFAFILAYGDYVSPSLLGGSKPPTLSILIVDVVKSGANWPQASVVAVMMTCRPGAGHTFGRDSLHGANVTGPVLLTPTRTGGR